MPETVTEKSVLSQALAKLNALPEGERGEFQPDEMRALQAFASARASGTLGEREKAFCQRVEDLLRLYHAQPNGAASSEQRKNMLLREGIDKCIEGRFEQLTVIELRIVHNTAAQLDSLTELSPSHERLRGLVAQALAAYAATQSEPAAEESDAVPAQTALRGVNAEKFFEGGTRTRLREFGEIPIDANARVVEHNGNLEIDGNVPDDVTLVVRDGDVKINGQCAGNVLANGSIEVEGNIAGSWTVSLDGDVRCERVLGGANILAPHGTIRCSSMERSGRIYAGAAIFVDKDTRGGQLVAPQIEVNGAIRGTQSQVLNSLVCGSIEGDARETASIVFRNVLSSEDYEVDLSEEAQAMMRDASRFRFREAVGESIVACIRADFCGVQCTRLFAVSGKNSGVDLASLRVIQSKAAYLSVTVCIGSMLEQVLLEALELGGDAHVGALKIGCDECQQAVKFLEREATWLSDDPTRETKTLITSSCKHLGNLAKKIVDCTGNRSGLEDAAQALLSRMTEWRTMRDTAARSLSEILHNVRAAIGKEPVAETEPARLGHAVNMAMQAAGSAGLTGAMRSLKALAERYVVALAHYTQGAEEVSAERKRLEAKLAADPNVNIGPGRNALRFAKADQFGPHVVLSTSPGLTPPATGSPEPGDGRCIRVDRQLTGPATFKCDGLTLRRETP